jgi:hypothetical protein
MWNDEMLINEILGGLNIGPENGSPGAEIN